MAERIPIHLRDATAEDRDLLLEWANDPAVRASAFNSHQIAPAEHAAWFGRVMADPANVRIFIGATAQGQAIGQVRFNRRESGAWDVDYSVAAAMRGQGLAVDLLRTAIARLDRLVGPATIHGWVKAGNARSASVFARLQFVLTQTRDSGDQLFQRMPPKQVVVLATPHRRNDGLSDSLAIKFSHIAFVRVRSREELLAIRDWRQPPSWIFFPHWSWLVPAPIYDAFRCVIFHMTDLPYGRGGSPLQNLIVRGHTHTVISAIRCESGLDTGDVYEKADLSLEGTAEQILVRANDVILDLIQRLIADEPTPIPQHGEVVSFTRRTPADGNIGSLHNLPSIYDFIRMLDAEGYPPAFAEIGRLRFEFSQAKLEDGFVEARVRIRITKNDQ